MSDGYERTLGTRTLGVLLGAWVLATEFALAAVAQLGGCGEDVMLDGELVANLLSDARECPGSDMAGAAIRLQPRLHDGFAFGLAPGNAAGFVGQTYALGLMLVATVVTIVLTRWPHRSGGDGMVLGLVWGGALASAVPRLVGDGRGLSSLELFGLHTGIAEIALVWGLAWLAVRLIAEARNA